MSTCLAGFRMLVKRAFPWRRPHKQATRTAGPSRAVLSREHMTRLVERLIFLIIRLIIQTIRRNRTRSVWIDEASNVSRPDPSGADQIDAEHQAMDLAVGGSNPSRRATISPAQRPCHGVAACCGAAGLRPNCTPSAGTPNTAAIPCDPIAHNDAANPGSRHPPAAAVGCLLGLRTGVGGQLEDSAAQGVGRSRCL
jgi:hypothetical protein